MKHRLFHGTQDHHIAKIVKNGLTGQHQSGWYQLATNFETALFHATSMEDKPKSMYVIELEVESSDSFWDGYPTLWPPHVTEDYSWYAIKEDIPSDCVKAVYEVPFELYMEQKNIGLKNNPKDLISLSRNILKRSHEQNYDSSGLSL